MIIRRAFADLGGADFGWLQARLHIAIEGLGNPDHGAVASLKVWNDDTFAPGHGFPLHVHRDIEIITYVREGAITHKDSLGNESRIVAGDVQVMSAGSGIRHSEFNAEKTPTRLFQIWIDARTLGGPPKWATQTFPRASRSGRLTTLASGKRQSDSLVINADACVFAANMRRGEKIEHELSSTECGYLVTATGRINLNGIMLGERDGASIDLERCLFITAVEDAEIILVTLVKSLEC